jgi:hypothetical protein
MAKRETYWKATHEIRYGGHGERIRRIRVMLLDGAAYTFHEWLTTTAADFAVVDGGWLFMGQPFNGTVRCLPTKVR